MQEAATDIGVTLNSWTETADEAAQQLLVQEGYQPLRYFWRMEIEMDAPPPLPVWPDGITVRTFVPGQDNRATYEAMDEGFRDSWGYEEGTFEEWERYGLQPAILTLRSGSSHIDGNEDSGRGALSSRCGRNRAYWLD